MTIFIDGAWRDTNTTPMLIVVDLDDIDVITDIGSGYGNPFFIRVPIGFHAVDEFHHDAMQKLEAMGKTIEELAGLTETKGSEGND